MKLLALHLVVILLVGSHPPAIMAVLQTTTGQPPSLPSPHRSPVTTMMTPPSIKLIAINGGTSTSTSTNSTSTNNNKNSNKRLTAHDHRSVNDESNEDSTTVSGHNATTAGVQSSRGRSIGSSSIQNESLRRLYQQHSLPSLSSSVQQVQQQYQHRRQYESPTRQSAMHHLQTTKTPRMIQRLVAGHIQNIPSNEANSEATTLKSTTLPRRNPFRSPKVSLHHLAATSTKKPSPGPIDAEDREDDDDAAFLDDPGDFDNWDNGILRASAGSGNENSAKGKKKDEAKKTLSDQVRDGKYGLIEKELFRREPKRPGVISYLPNKEVPIDNERNFGGLDEDDIWLAEDHLLVLKGGSLNEREPSEPWPPLDDYDAPGRQIKIPPNPKVPPPFPVQLEENGPIQFIGDSKISIVYPITNESVSLYTAGQETPNQASEADRDHEKNLLTRPGTAGSTEKGQNNPSYFYPKPYPPWLFHNQSFVNPFTNTRPIPFPGIGPFLNGSLEKFNGTDFDEDDPSLYYPPPYSFVYKSNYSNPVPPGPLVPGIVLPPPPNAFARLEKPRNKHPVYTTTTTTELPLREVIANIPEYTPNLIAATTPKSTRPLGTTIQPPPPTTFSKLQPAPIQKEVYYSVSTPAPPPPKIYSTPKSNFVSFVPTTARQPNKNSPTLTKSNPIYYEYFEARKEAPTTQNYVPEFIPNTPVSPQRQQYKPQKVNNKSKMNGNSQHYYTTTTTPRPSAKQQYAPTNRPQFVYEDFVYITPKPEIRPNGISNSNHNYIPYQAPVKVPPLKNNRPYESFEREVNAIRQTLRFYQSQQIQDNSIPRTPKAKPIYDYNFSAAKPTSRNFNPPEEYDSEPFKPMVTYSPPVDDENAFRAIAFEKVDNDLPAVQSFYNNPTTVEPQPEVHTRQQKKIRIGAKYLQPLVTPYDRDQSISGRPIEYSQVTTPRTILTTEKPWVTVEKQVVQEVAAPAKLARIQAPPRPAFQGQFQGYYYNPPNRQNNRYFDEPFYPQSPPTRKVINQRPPQHRPQHQQQQVWSLENDTYVNYAPNRPPLNPEAEFINPYQPFNQYFKPQMSQAQRLPPSSVQNPNTYFPPPVNRVPPNRQQQQISLHRDTLVNYRQPLPPINPESEYISIPSRNQPQHQQQQLPLPSYRAPAQYRDPPPQGGNVYILTPNHRRANIEGDY